jgi:hypothetical protein
MSSITKPFDFSEIVGCPNYIPENILDNVFGFGFHEGDDACDHIKAFWNLIDDWDDTPIHEDALMQLFSWTLLEDQGSACDWFLMRKDKSIRTIQDFLHGFLERFGDDQDEVYNELIDDLMAKWKRKNLSNIKTISSDIEVDIPPDPIKELKETIINMQFAHEEQCEAMDEQFVAIEDQLEIMEDDFTETYIKYSDPHGLELDSEKYEDVHEEILDECMDESVIYFEVVKEVEFETIEYLDDLSSHPPPNEPIILKDNFENLEENSMMVPVICSSSVSQPKDKLMQDYVELEGTFSLSMSYHYEYWLASHLDSHEQQSIQILHDLSYSSVWLKGRRMMILGWFFLIKSSKLIKLGKGSFVSHPGLGLFRHLRHHFTHSMGGCNVSLTLPCILILYYFNLLCQYVLRNFFSIVVSCCSFIVVL